MSSSYFNGYISDDADPYVSVPPGTPTAPSFPIGFAPRNDRRNARKKEVPASPCVNTRVIRGGFDLKDTRPDMMDLKKFPPPSNITYDLTTDGHLPEFDPKFRHLYPHKPVDLRTSKTTTITTTTGMKYRKATVTDVVEETNDEENGVFQMGDISESLNSSGATTKPSLGHLLAEGINFNRPSMVTTSPEVSLGQVIYPADEQRLDFIKNIDQGAPLMYCSKCKKTHIPPGSPITLEDRDTCYSFLPGWFPTDGVDRPWDKYTEILNDLVKQDEILQGYPNQLGKENEEWDLQFHEPSSSWKEAGRTGGWWKCEKTEGAPMMERMCNLCHGLKPVSKKTMNERMMAQIKKKEIVDFIDHCTKETGKRDRAIAEDRMRREGIPQHFGGEHSHPASVDAIVARDGYAHDFQKYLKHGLSGL